MTDSVRQQLDDLASLKLLQQLLLASLHARAVPYQRDHPGDTTFNLFLAQLDSAVTRLNSLVAAKCRALGIPPEDIPSIEPMTLDRIDP